VAAHGVRTDRHEELREQLVVGLVGADAHTTFEDATREYPESAINERPPNVGYTPWHLVEHLRLTQRDMLEYVGDPGYAGRVWPRDYWPDASATATPAAFRASVEAFIEDRDAFVALVRDPSVDPLAPIPHAPRHTIARCVRVIANHNSYHVGELAILRQVTGTWGPAHR
jgi:hypothetical protein